MQQIKPANPVAAVTEANPYPYYAELVAHKPMYYDDSLRCWVASSAAAVRAVLTSELCRVRPLSEPVPSALVGTSSGDIFKHLIRMNDGEKHDPMKQAVASTLSEVDTAQVAEQGRRWARLLVDELRLRSEVAGLSEFAFRLPIYVVASLLGIPESTLHQTACWTREFAAGLAPASGQEQLKQGNNAAINLLDTFHSLLSVRQSELSGGLLAMLAHEAKAIGHNNDVIIANAIGFLSQTYDATAGLIGSALLALARQTDIREQVVAHSTLLPPFVQEVLRLDSPIQNTRRFVAQNCVIAGQNVSAGEMVLVVLAAANRDSTANPRPEKFELFRENRQLFTFGVGVHTCPGEQIASAIAVAALETLIESEFDFGQFNTPISYRASVNARIPLFAH